MGLEAIPSAFSSHNEEHRGQLYVQCEKGQFILRIRLIFPRVKRYYYSIHYLCVAAGRKRRKVRIKTH